MEKLPQSTVGRQVRSPGAMPPPPPQTFIYVEVCGSATAMQTVGETCSLSSLAERKMSSIESGGGVWGGGDKKNLHGHGRYESRLCDASGFGGSSPHGGK